MKIDLTGRTAFVTGGSKGIGKAIVQSLAACGANVGVMARGRNDLDATVAEVNALGGGRVIGVAGDVADYDSIAAAVAQTAQTFGGLHLAVNNAGISGAEGLLHESGPGNWRTVMGVNLDGVGFAMMAEIAQMLEAGGGSIVNIASVEAHTVLRHFPVYTATKHALIGLTKGTAADYASLGIRVNSVSPGVIRTPLTMAPGQKEVTDRLEGKIPSGRLGESEEVARTVTFLLSDLSAYTTGTDVVVDGAFLLRE
ncbi:SDR family oxidoreductase [Streptomyces sp. NPDC047737]|uniref:SDR family NAD(P)-dependent oxidoreductase n=1 Tax=Streptomyces sp. NPDC047737 TaxID=3155740 RepID=UPI0033D8EAE6